MEMNLGLRAKWQNPSQTNANIATVSCSCANKPFFGKIRKTHPPLNAAMLPVWWKSGALHWSAVTSGWAFWHSLEMSLPHFHLNFNLREEKAISKTDKNTCWWKTNGVNEEITFLPSSKVFWFFNLKATPEYRKSCHWRTQRISHLHTE